MRSSNKPFVPYAFFPNKNNNNYRFQLLTDQQGKFRLRLHGIRIPQNYTVILRLTDYNQRPNAPAKPDNKRKRRRQRGNSKQSTFRRETPPPSDSEGATEDTADDIMNPSVTVLDAKASALEKELAEQEDEQVRLTNAYPGASNTIGSVHQRSWHLSLDKVSSGFVRDGKKRWVRGVEGGSGSRSGRMRGFEAFYVRGREVERSVVTGRMAKEVCEDEGVVGFVGRAGWRAVLE